jgi:2-polyprenyl-3-methyl-5-hydroxy-6-metoxy-1,4-benzoquinol methylase
VKDNVQQDYGWNESAETEANELLFPSIQHIVERLGGSLNVLDIGCGNGTLVKLLCDLGHNVVGVDASKDGIDIARKQVPDARFEVASIYDDDFNQIVGSGFDLVISLEVIEHLYWPKILPQKVYKLLKPYGTFIISTPYHGYLKNFAISLFNGWDRHFTVDWDGGHIKFYSRKSLTNLLEENGFYDITFLGLGRVHYFWKSMVLTGKK